MKKHYIGIIALGLSFSGKSAESHGSYSEVGVASYYHDCFDGCATANGEKFSQTEMTCAHLWLPLNTIIKVTSLKNHKSIIVRVNDRGPYIDGRMIDLSRSAAAILGFTEDGLTMVKMETMSRKSYLAFCAEDFDAAKRMGYSRNNALPVENVAISSGVMPVSDTAACKGINRFDVNKMSGYTCRIQRNKKLSYLVFIGIFYRPEKNSPFQEERKAKVPDVEPLRFFDKHVQGSWIAA